MDRFAGLVAAEPAFKLATMAAQVREQFHPLIRRWLAERFAAPTDAQAQAWPVIAAGEHVLVSAPTGSGKTLTTFLSAIDNLVRGRRTCGGGGAPFISRPSRRSTATCG